MVVARHAQAVFLNIKTKIMTISKVKSVQASGTFDGKHGTLYKFEYTMEDDKTLTANHKSGDNYFKIGQEVDYEIKGTNDYGAWGTVKKPDSPDFQRNASSTPKGGVTEDLRQLMIVRQSSLNRAVEVCMHNSIQIVGNGESHYPQSVVEKEILELAERFTKWVMATEPVAQSEKVQELAQSATDSLMNEKPPLQQ